MWKKIPEGSNHKLRSRLATPVGPSPPRSWYLDISLPFKRSTCSIVLPANLSHLR